MLPPNVVSLQVNELVQFLLVKDQKKIPIKRAGKSKPFFFFILITQNLYVELDELVGVFVCVIILLSRRLSCESGLL